MSNVSEFSRRQVLQLGALGGLLAVGTSCAPALAASRGLDVRVTDLGPGVENFALQSAIPVGDRVFVASRNIDPMRIIGYDLNAKKVTSITPATGYATQLLAADPEERYVYAAIEDRGLGGYGFCRLDITKPGAPREDIAQITYVNPRALAVSPDGKVFFGGSEKAPKLRMYDPATGALTVVATPDPKVPMIRCLVATEDKVYIGTGASLGSTPETTRAGLFVMDRATNEVTSILPPEFEGGAEVRDIGLYGDTLYVCCTVAAGGAVAAVNVNDPSDYRIYQSDRGFLRLPRLVGDKLYLNGATLMELTLSTGVFREIVPVGVEYGEIWGLWTKGDRVWVVSAFGLILDLDPATGIPVVYDLVEGGAPVGPQLGMSVAAGAGGVYVGGNNSVMRHDVATGAKTRILAPSEAKDILIRDRVAYFAQYSDIGILAHDPRSDGQWTRKLSDLPDAQNRPHQIVWDDVHRLALVGIQSDTRMGGSLMTFDPVTKKTTVAVNPIDAGQAVRAVYSHEGIAYLGGDGSGATVVAWDPIAQRELWRVNPQTRATGITGLTVNRGKLYILCRKGELFVVDLRSRQVVHSANHRAVVPDQGTLLHRSGQVFGTSNVAFFHIDPTTYARTDLVTLDSEWYGIPRAALDEKGHFYTLQGRNLVRIEVSRN